MSITAFVSYILLMAYTPGPNNILAMTHAGQHGLRQTVRLLLGMFTGFFLVMGGGALFSSALYRYLPSVEPGIRILGALYILYLAWNVFRPKGGKQGETGGKRLGYWSGFVLQCVNVKVIFFGLTAMSTFVLPHYRQLGEVIFFALVMVFSASLSNWIWAFCGSLFQRFFIEYGKIINAVMALLLVYCAGTLVWPLVVP